LALGVDFFFVSYCGLALLFCFLLRNHGLLPAAQVQKLQSQVLKWIQSQ